MRGLACALMLVNCIGVVPAHAQATEEARVLILNGTDPYLPAFLLIDSAMRTSLAQESARRVVFFSEPLDGQRFRTAAFETELVALFDKKYAGIPIDVVVAISQPALDFFKRHGAQLWPNARVVFHGWPGEIFDPTGLPPGAMASVTTAPFAETIDLAQRMQPDARRIVVISGSADLDRKNEELARQALLNAKHPLPSEILTGVALPELTERVATEPADSIILYLSQFRDRDGRPYTPREVLRAFSARSHAPVYGVVETYVGHGMAAGFAESYEEHGRMLGRMILDAFNRDASVLEPTLVEVKSRCIADARALRHWSLDERRLPDGCEVRFADVALWRQYLWPIILALAVMAGQTLLIVALFYQRRHRRIAEGESRARLSEMAHMNRSAAIGGLAASIAHELNQPLGAICNNAGAAQILLKAESSQSNEVAAILGDIKEDGKRASEVIARVRAMMRKTTSEAGELDLNSAITDTAKLLATEARDKGVELKTDLDANLPRVRGDRVPVQQVILNLALNAIEAVQDLPAEKRTLAIRSARLNDKEAVVSVTDSGGGVAANLLSHVFEPFVTSKASGMGLGLSISRTIVEAHRGSIRAENLPAGGAAFHFTLPFFGANPA